MKTLPELARKPLLIVLVLLCLAPAEAAAGWSLFSMNGDALLFYDPLSVVQAAPGLVRLNVRMLYDNGRDEKVKQELDCLNRVVRDIAVILDDVKRPQYKAGIVPEWRPFERDSDSGGLYRSVCSLAAPLL